MTTTQRIVQDEVELRDRRQTRIRRASEISVFVQPDVALHQTRDGTVLRHLARRVTRVVAIAAGDAVAAGFAAVAVRELVAQLAARLGRGHIPYSGAGEFCVAVVLALLLTGNYQRSKPAHPTLHLLVGSALGALVVCWSNFWAMPTVGAIPVAFVLTGVTASTLFVSRGVLGAITARVLPEERRLIPAVVVAADRSMDATMSTASGYRVAGRLTLDRRDSELRDQELARLIRQTRAESVVVFGQVDRGRFARLLEITLNAGCELLCTPPGFDVPGMRPAVAWRGPYGFVAVGAPVLKAPQMFAKRVVDVLGASVALVLAAPLWALIAVAIRLDSPGPVFFRQERVGLGGRRFDMLKFRTMRVGADAEKGAVAHLNASGDRRLFKIPNDPRISRVGRVLRRWSLDELPQFLNVVRGHMSLVGPRPFFEDDLAAYERHHFRRLGAKPGITGLWQVSGRSTVTDFEEVVRMDTEYIDQWSLWLDMKILLLTLPAVLRRTGAC